MATTFKFAGVSRINGSLKVRFSDRDIYTKALVKANNTDINIVDLGEPMTKEQAIAYLLESDFAQGSNEIMDVLQAAADRRSVKAARDDARARGEIRRGRKPKAQEPVVEPETAPVVEAELEDAPF